MATFCVFTRAEAPQFAKLLMFLLELPRRDPNLSGAGLFPDTSTPPPNPCPANWPGWTTRHRGWLRKNTNTGAQTDEFAIRVTQDLQDAWQAKKNLLTPGQRAFVQGHLDSAADLAADGNWVRTLNGQTGLFETDDVEPEP